MYWYDVHELAIRLSLGARTPSKLQYFCIRVVPAGLAPWHLTPSPRILGLGPSCLLVVVQLDLADNSGRTALHMASHDGQTSALAEILGRSVDLDIRDERGETALHAAASSGKVGF